MKIPALHYYDISPNAIAFSSTRHGGYGNGNYKEFNINLFCGDSPEAISKNKTALCRELGIEESALVFPHQIHQTRGVVIDNARKRNLHRSFHRRLRSCSSLLQQSADNCSHTRRLARHIEKNNSQSGRRIKEKSGSKCRKLPRNHRSVNFA